MTVFVLITKSHFEILSEAIMLCSREYRFLHFKLIEKKISSQSFHRCRIKMYICEWLMTSSYFRNTSSVGWLDNGGQHIFFKLKGSVNFISSDPPCNEDNARFTKVICAFFIYVILEKCSELLFESEKRQCFPHF